LLTVPRYFSAVEAAGTVAPMASLALGEGRITRERYWQLVADGVIGPDDRVELLEGVIVAMSPQNPPHAGVVGKLTEWLGGVVRPQATLRVQLPLELSALSVPEPDVAVVPGHPEDYMTAHPTTALLVVEVADSSVIQDRLTKAAIYAAAGIAEYWLVNLRARAVEVHRAPLAGDRRYTDVRISRADSTLDLVAFPGATIVVSELLPSI
jgi:Uma2 family endonuclease